MPPRGAAPARGLGVRGNAQVRRQSQIFIILMERYANASSYSVNSSSSSPFFSSSPSSPLGVGLPLGGMARSAPPAQHCWAGVGLRGSVPRARRATHAQGPRVQSRVWVCERVWALDWRGGGRLVHSPPMRRMKRQLRATDDTTRQKALIYIRDRCFRAAHSPGRGARAPCARAQPPPPPPPPPGTSGRRAGWAASRHACRRGAGWGPLACEAACPPCA